MPWVRCFMPALLWRFRPLLHPASSKPLIEMHFQITRQSLLQTFLPILILSQLLLACQAMQVNLRQRLLTSHLPGDKNESGQKNTAAAVAASVDSPLGDISAG